VSISIEEAIRISIATKAVLLEEEVAINESLGRILAKDIEAKISQPPFRRSAMDGYALRKSDFHGEKMKVITEVDAGDERIIKIEEGQAVRIMTGACVPDACDIVVPQEMTDYGEEEVLISSLPSRDNISPVGEDFKKGEIIAKKGSVINAQILSCLAAAGVLKLPVIKRLRVSIVMTGDEIQEVGSELLPGHIYDSNSVYIEKRLKELSCDVVYFIREKDNLNMIAEDVLHAIEVSDYVITLGGVSVGKKDHLEACMKKIGADILFHGVAVKPGMPTMLSIKNGVPILSLSGNPYSAAALFEILFPYNRYICLKAKLNEKYENKHEVPRLVRGYYSGENLTLAVNQRNGSTFSNIYTNCIAEIPGCKDAIRDTVRIRLLSV